MYKFECLGFEIEKLRFHGSSVREYPLLKGFEYDGSCGVEAITHVLPLLGKSLWRTKVFNMFVQAKKIISDEYSPSDSSCGGHDVILVAGKMVLARQVFLRPSGRIAQQCLLPE